MNDKLPFLYKMILATLLMQTVVVSNIIKGLLLPYVLIIFLIISSIFYRKKSNSLVKNYIYIIIFLMLYILLNNISQLFNLASNFNLPFDSSLLISKELSSQINFRKSLFTQSLYFIICVSFYFLTLNYMKRHTIEVIMKYVKIGLIIFITYGYFLYFGFIFTGASVDFLSNRVTGEDNAFGGADLQHVVFGGLDLPRFQSLVGEPSMFAFAIVPFFIYYYYLKEKFMYINLLIVLLLSTSGTAIVGIISFFMIDLFSYRKTTKLVLLFLIVASFFVIININIILDFYNFFYSKINLEHISGIVRFDNFNQSIDFFENLNFFNQMFGIGFGYIRSTDGFSTILVNNGIVGIVVILLLYLYPIFTLRAKSDYLKAIKISNIVIVIMLMTSVPEFYNLHIYLFFAILWHETTTQKGYKIVNN